ncbi:AGE family epimerase/isomerase [Aestuariivirga litoralis]|uniref:AGE family epimerase/isomerase n=1 Tax=Aestuariivirga litoralis TaxID=2650924 RepID=UPI0018C46BDA|nr:AGE family epimerase/isomerase [Aestuariivirga litoralis]MBG1231459.1 AGE family epimerase/isomerase [Aestuariivirga litoralis]
MTAWRKGEAHRAWLRKQADSLFDFYQAAALHPVGGFYQLGDDGKPMNALRQLHATCRMVHCFALGQLLGREGAARFVDHGMDYLWKAHRDTAHGGYVWSLNNDGIVDGSKQGYGHAFVLLGASSAKIVGHPDADRLLADVSEVLTTRFWDEQAGAQREEFARDWSEISTYRGQNSNMHLVEALIAAHEATDEGVYLQRAERIAALIIGKHAADLRWRVAEHFDEKWNVDFDYQGNDVFRPAGTTPGHSLEWARLLLQLWELGGRRQDWMKLAAAKLFKTSIAIGWDQDKGGFYYALDWQNRPRLRQKLWWPMTEAIGAAHFLAEHDEDPFFEEWYQRLWNFCDAHFIDHAQGGWHVALGDDLKPAVGFEAGKPDLYHALQACLIPLYPATGSLTSAIRSGI